MNQSVFFSGWDVLLRTATITFVAYPMLLLIVRVSGHRSLSQMNAFDLIVTIALGSVLSSMITSSDISLSQGLLAFALLLTMQFAISWGSSRFRRFERAVNGEPILLVYQGRVLEQALLHARITEDEVKAAVRSQGAASMQEVEAVVLETNGKLSVVKRASEHEQSALAPVPNVPPSL